MLTCLQSDFDEIILFTKPVNRSNTLFWILRIEHGKYFMDETQSSAYISTHLEVSSNTIQVLHTHTSLHLIHKPEIPFIFHTPNYIVMIHCLAVVKSEIMQNKIREAKTKIQLIRILFIRLATSWSVFRDVTTIYCVQYTRALDILPYIYA